MDTLQNYILIISTIVTLLGSITAIIISIRRAPIQERQDENLADKLQTENAINLLKAQKTLLDPMNKRMEQLENENRGCKEEYEAMQKQLEKAITSFELNTQSLEIKIKDLETRVVEAEHYIDRLLHFIKSYNLTPPPRNMEELKKIEEEGKK